MELYHMTDTEIKFANIIWENEPIASGELVKCCSEQFDWKKSTTYTFLKKLCEHHIFQNISSTVTSIISREEYLQRQGESFVEKAYEGSLPKMIAAFMDRKRLTTKQIEEIKKMIDNYEEVE